jgi:hypothetical protein
LVAQVQSGSQQHRAGVFAWGVLGDAHLSTTGRYLCGKVDARRIAASMLPTAFGVGDRGRNRLCRSVTKNVGDDLADVAPFAGRTVAQA